MEEAQEILLNSLKNAGVSLPEGVSLIRDFTPDALVSICARSLHLIDDLLSFPTSLPDSMAEKFKICTEISSTINNLGYRGDLSFHQFLYPSEEDSYKLVRFLVERLSETSEDGKTTKGALKDWTGKVGNPDVDQNYQTVRTRLKELRLKREVPESSDTMHEDVFVNGSHEGQQTGELAAADVPRSESLESSREEELRSVEDVRDAMEESGDSRKDASGNKESAVQRNDSHATELEKKLASLQERSSKMRNAIKDLRSQEKMLKEEVTAKTLESQHLEGEHELLKAAVEMALDNQQPVDFYIEELTKRVEAGRQKLVELESQWDASVKPLEEEKRNHEQLLHAKKPEVQEKLQKVKEVELETEAIISEIRKREEEHSKLVAELENQPKLPSRKSYVQRITEITKNSRKQDADIQRILKETRELQIDSNSIQDRLHRTYAVVDETMFRDAKTDTVRRQAYRLLTSIHESFEQISEKILTTDRIRREVAEQETKLTATTASRSLNTDKLEADLNAIRRENEFLEQQHLHD